MKKAIFVLNSNEDYSFLTEEYAKNNNLDVLYVKNKDNFDENIKNYDRVLFLNNLILLTPNSPDIFENVPEDKIGVYGSLKQKEIIPDVVVMSKKHFDFFDNKLYAFLINENFLKQSLVENIEMLEPIGFRFNRKPILDSLSGEHRLKSYFINYNDLVGVMPQKNIEEIMRSDLEDYKNDNYRKNFNVAVQVTGGLGDLVAAEPTVRYICEKLYKNDNVIIQCYAPELFAHIDRPIYKPEDMVPEASSYYIMTTLIGQENPHAIHGVVSPILVHACNYASLSCLRSELRRKDRQIKLKVDEKAFETLDKKVDNKYDDLVLLHMGVSWESKTIPGEFWDVYIKAVRDLGKTPVLIGKDLENDFRGVVKDVNAEGCIDLRNKLEINELVALVSKAPVLISNDSFPVHIAGAFDNHIGLIATCKSAEYILPHRGDGDIFYKAQDLSKFPLYQDYEARPNYIEGSRVDKVDPERLAECLPDYEDVQKFLEKCFEEKNEY